MVNTNELSLIVPSILSALLPEKRFDSDIISAGCNKLILIATGSEVELVLQAQQRLKENGIAARVVSMPSWELFEKQDESYKQRVFPKGLKKRLAVEAGSPLGWHKYVTDEGAVLGMTRFGESAPAADLFKEFGFTVENVVNKAKALTGR